MKKSIILAAALGALATLPALAHHSHAMFDHSLSIETKGVVNKWIFTNPHVWLLVDAPSPDGSGQTVTWAFEGSYVINMQGQGFTATTFTAGDEVTVRSNPLRDGKPGGNFISVTLADGTTLGD